MNMIFGYTKNCYHDGVLATRARGVKLYFVHNGRNAWHSTWTQKYHPDCIHLSMQSAKAYCEKHRNNGTVFYILEMPALELHSGSSTVLITQINAASPLAGYTATTGIALDEDQQDDALPSGLRWRVGDPLNAVANSFLPDSDAWPAPPPSDEKIIILGCVVLKSPLMPLAGMELRSWKSWSAGARHPLQWKDHAIRRSCRGIFSILEQVNPPAQVLPISDDGRSTRATPLTVEQ